MHEFHLILLIGPEISDSWKCAIVCQKQSHFPRFLILNYIIFLHLIVFLLFIMLIKYLIFYLHQGGEFSTEWISQCVGLTLIISIPIAKLTRFSSIRSSKKQITISSVVIILCMSSLATMCITEGAIGLKISHIIRQFAPLPIFIIVTFFHIAGITRNLWLIVHQTFSSYPLSLHLRVMCTALSWFIIFIITNLLPRLLYSVGAGYCYAYSVIFMIISLAFLQKLEPISLYDEHDKTLHDSNTPSTSSCEFPTKSVNSSCNEIQEI